MTTIALIQNKVLDVSSPRINWKLFYCIGGLVCFALLVFYVISINQLTGGTYLIKNFNKQIDSLTQQNLDLQAQFAQTGFMGNIQEKTQQMGFEKVGQISYVQILYGPVAMVNK